MKFLLLLALATVTAGQTIEEQVKKFDKHKSYTVRHDKFAQSTTVDFQQSLKTDGKGFIATGYLWVTASTTLENNKRTFLLWFTGHTRIYDRPTLRLLLDGKLLDIESFSGIREYAAFEVTPEQWAKITSAKTVELQLVTFETKLDDKFLKAMRNLASLTN